MSGSDRRSWRPHSAIQQFLWDRDPEGHSPVGARFRETILPPASYTKADSPCPFWLKSADRVSWMGTSRPGQGG